MILIEYPHLMTKQEKEVLLRAWEAAIPRFSFDYKLEVYYGTKKQ
jgi:hypothetical protein